MTTLHTHKHIRGPNTVVPLLQFGLLLLVALAVALITFVMPFPAHYHPTIPSYLPQRP